MILENSKIINVDTVSLFGRGTLATQISELFNLKVTGYYDDFHKFEELPLKTPVIYAVGYKDLFKKRTRLRDLLLAGYNVCSFVADNSIISTKSIIGNGVIINQGAIIDNFVELENGVFINIGVSVSHHTTLKECVFVGPNATIAGNVLIGPSVFIGAGSTIINDVEIGEGSVVAAGAVVTKDVPPFSLVAGVPAIIKKHIGK